MKPSEIIVGLDIGTTKIACIVGRKNDKGKIEILGFGRANSMGVARGMVANIQLTVDSIKAAVSEASAQFKEQITDVHIGIAGQHIRSAQHKGSIIRASADIEISKSEIARLTNDMYKLVMAPGEDIIDVIPQEYTIDGEPGIKQPVGMLGSKIEANFHIITGQTSAGKNILTCANLANLKMLDLIIEPMASARAVLVEDEKEAGVVLVDIGGGTTDIAIFHDNMIRHTAVIPFGGNIITEDIREGCNVIRSHAEALKISFGSALASLNQDNEKVSIPGIRGRAPREISLKNLASIIQARMTEIIDQVYLEIKNSGVEKKLGAGIVLTGGGALLRHIDQLVAFQTGMEVRIGYPNEHLAPGVSEALSSPMYATSIGLVAEGIHRKLIAEDIAQIEHSIAATHKKNDVLEAEEKRPVTPSFFQRVMQIFERDMIE